MKAQIDKYEYYTDESEEDQATFQGYLDLFKLDMRSIVESYDHYATILIKFLSEYSPIGYQSFITNTQFNYDLVLMIINDPNLITSMTEDNFNEQMKFKDWKGILEENYYME